MSPKLDDAIHRAVDRIKVEISAVLEAGGHYLPQEQELLLQELSYKAGCLADVIVHNDRTPADVRISWEDEADRSRRRAARRESV